ncbi:MAG: ribonuclease HII [Brevibacterium sp.]|uniref:ribonuclease HII n=1 Tax=Brevibacterium sp. TaxID=1701 RepID=UPI0026482B40|nr:ribonuclease HII [Brevibacterium sp.]MDN5807518.1 ribonuclease HII [Brevibacterium sp.]MDN5833340.1 ribonuclease HII [Brevibacterium sp.]MDN5877009.1 ribonuclease HII [Brevibacterium sp.]MDN5908635.1 ribonuclease HII [Brevibacterium sp.]MDN6123341.1 ribonuclease HII [Brevibacterium sp.]
MAQAGLHDLSLERALLAEGYECVIGIDEVGRGALAGPVSVGVALFDLTTLTTAEVPEGIHDSKQLSALSRQTATARVTGWARATAVGSTSPNELDELGMTMALNLAGRRALCDMLVPLLGSASFPPSTMVLLDGKHDWLSAPLTLDCLGTFGSAADLDLPQVRTVIKGDGSVPVIAAASIVAKVHRDEAMIALAQAHPQYGWESNVGYGTIKHRRGIADSGPSIHHRRSFRLQTTHDAKEESL